MLPEEHGWAIIQGRLAPDGKGLCWGKWWVRKPYGEVRDHFTSLCFCLLSLKGGGTEPSLGALLAPT